MRKAVISPQKNDQKIIEYLFRVKVATIYQLMRDNPSLYAQRPAFVRRLNQLVVANLIQKFWHERRLAYTIGKRGLEYLASAGWVAESWSLKYIAASPYQLDHDLLLTDIYSHLEHLLPNATVETHNQLLRTLEERTESHNIPDARIRFDPTFYKKELAVELEWTLKDKGRYESIFDNYYDSSQTGAVLYLVRHSAAKKTLTESDSLARLGETSRIFVGLIDEFLKDPTHCFFVSSEKQIFQFARFLKKMTAQNGQSPVVTTMGTSRSQQGYSLEPSAEAENQWQSNDIGPLQSGKSRHHD